MFDMAAKMLAVRSGIVVCTKRVYRYDAGYVEEHGVRTAVDLRRGDFVGLYPGEWFDGIRTLCSDRTGLRHRRCCMRAGPRAEPGRSESASAKVRVDATFRKRELRYWAPHGGVHKRSERGGPERVH